MSCLLDVTYTMGKEDVTQGYAVRCHGRDEIDNYQMNMLPSSVNPFQPMSFLRVFALDHVKCLSFQPSCLHWLVTALDDCAVMC